MVRQTAKAVCYERFSAKPAGDKQPKGCLDYSAPDQMARSPLKLLYFYSDPFDYGCPNLFLKKFVRPVAAISFLKINLSP